MSTAQQKFTMPVDKVVATRVGHTIEFKAGVPTHVPKVAWPEVSAAGAVPEDAEAVHAQAPAKPEAPDDPTERKERAFAAFETIVAGNKREDFTAAGVPSAHAIEKALGFKLDTKERDALWTDFQQSKGV